MLLRLETERDLSAGATLVTEQSAGPGITELIDEHYSFVYGFLYRLSGSRDDAEDLTQQTFMSAHSSLSQLREPSKARGWLCTIGRNAFLKMVSKRKRVSVDLEALPEIAEETDADSEIDGEQLQQLLDQMPVEFRSTIIMFYYEGFSYREIAERMEIPIGTVMSRLARGKAWLRRRLGSARDELTEAEQKRG